MQISLPFGKSTVSAEVDDSRVRATLVSRFPEGTGVSEQSLVREAMARPTGSPPLAELARGKRRIVILTSDHTRPVPSHIILPCMLEEIRRSAPDADITILVATGCHRATTSEELRDRFGPILDRERVVVHDCDDAGSLRSIGTLPSGGDCVINSLALDADLLVAEGFIEPHFFAGYSGGRKAVLPGIAGRTAVLANHCAEFIAHPCARTGILDGNPIHADMIFAARQAGLAFIVNVVLDRDKRIAAAFAGDADAAHRAGCDWLRQAVEVERSLADIVVTSNGGYPLDQNLYQAVKSMTAAEACCRPGGTIIVVAECADGHGGEEFATAFARVPTPDALLADYHARDRNATTPDQWQIQIFCRILLHARVLMVTGPNAPRAMVEQLRMEHATTLEQALHMAGNGDITVIPDGVGVVVTAD